MSLSWCLLDIACLMPQRHLKYYMPQTELLTCSLTLHNKSTEKLSSGVKMLINYTDVLVRHLDEILLHLPPPPSQSTFRFVGSLLFVTHTWPLYFL